VARPAPAAVAAAPAERGAKARRAPARRAREKPALLAEPVSPATSWPTESEEAGALPASYGKTRVRLLMQSPGRLFVHWDLSPAVLDELKAQLGHRTAALARLAIRITVPGGGRPLMVLLPKGARSWYVDVPPHRIEYRAEIGLLLPSGEFRPAGTSNPIRMPRTEPSPLTAQHRVSADPARPLPKTPVGDIPADEPTEDELEAYARADVDVDEVVAEETASGGSSEMSGGSTPRRARGGPARPGPAGGSSSDLGPAGSSSDLTRRR
jgi:hypothetical protein